MPGQLAWTFRQGNRTEYLAAYLLSALGLAIKVPREEDIGIDFHCNLASTFQPGILSFYAPYNVQIKSIAADNTITYGGLQNSKFKHHEIRWLLSQREPFFIALVDKSTSTLKMYSTAIRWRVRYAEAIPHELILIPDTPESGVEIVLPEKETVEVSDLPEGIESCRWKLPLGQPIFTINAEQAEDQCYLSNTRGNFKDYIYMDDRNAVLHGMGLSSFHWPYRIITGQTLMEQGIAIDWKKASTVIEVQQQLGILAPLVASLQRTYIAEGNFDSAKKFSGLLDLIPDEQGFSFIRSMIHDSIRLIEAQDTGGIPALSAAPHTG